MLTEDQVAFYRENGYLVVPDVVDAAGGAAGAGIRVLGDGKPAKGYEGQDLFFMHPKDTLGTLIEIEEPNQ